MNETEKKISKPLRILVHAPLGIGGVTGLMLNIHSNVDREKLTFDYLVFHDRVEPQEHIAYKLGAKKIVASADTIKIKSIRGIVRLFKIRKVCKNNGYKIFHFNGGAPMGFLTMLAAKAGGIKYVTFHSHNGGMSNEGFLAKPVSALCKPFLNLVVSDYWACSELAAEFSFPKEIAEKKMYYFMPNAINLKEFAYDSKIREEIREELKLTGKFVIGHAGRFNHQKNHSFLIDIFEEIHRKNQDAVLLLFGEGELLEKVKEKVHFLNLDDYVIFYGVTNEMYKMYQAMDIFVMPSKFEGFPVTGVEAAAAALPIVFSDTITKEVQITDNICYLSLDKSAQIWADQVISYKGLPRIDQTEKLAKAGFEQSTMIEHFQEYYLNVGKKLKLI